MQLFFSRDVENLVELFTSILQKTPLRSHKRKFYTIGSILDVFYNALTDRSRLLGYKVYFAGKLGRKGSVKKSTIYLIRGRISFSSKNLRFSSKNFLVFTETGVVGCYLSLFYIKMLTSFLIYLFIYIFTSILFLGLIFHYIKLFNLSELPMAILASLLTKYTGRRLLHALLILFSGLPPTAFFFIKINILLDVTSAFGLLTSFIFSVNLVLGTFFYLQVFITSNKLTRMLKNTTQLLRNEDARLVRNRRTS